MDITTSLWPHHQEVFNKFSSHFYAALGSDAPGRNGPASLSLAFGDRIIPRKTDAPATWSPEYVECVLTLAILTTRELQLGAERLALVAREVQILVQRYLQDVNKTLRIALGLNDLSGGSKRLASEMCEPDASILAAREAVLKRRKTYSDLQLVNFFFPVLIAGMSSTSVTLSRPRARPRQVSQISVLRMSFVVKISIF